jgi:hypothetical protein
LEDILWHRRRARVRRWRERWQSALDDFLSVVVAGEAADPASFDERGSKVAKMLQSPLPTDLQAEHISVPTPFRRLDLTHLDFLALGQNFIRRFPDRFQAILLLGVRTSGSYFVPLLRALLAAEGYQTVSSDGATKRGLGRGMPGAAALRPAWMYGPISRRAAHGRTILLTFDIVAERIWSLAS